MSEVISRDTPHDALVKVSEYWIYCTKLSLTEEDFKI